MKIGILGSGAVGQTLAKAFLSEAHEVVLGTRNVEKPELVKWQKDNPKAKLGSFAEAASFGEVLVLTVAGSAALEVVQLAGIENLAGKPVIDTTNPIDSRPPVNGVLQVFTANNDSLMEALQRAAPHAKLVKAFNSVGNALMYKPSFKEGKPTMFICGNDAGAKQTVTSILTAFGWETEDMGAVEAARGIEPLCILWCIPGFRENRWNHAFKLLKP